MFVCSVMLLLSVVNNNQGTSCDGDDNGYGCLETTIKDERLVVALCGCTELHQLPSFEQQQKTRQRQISSYLFCVDRCHF